MRRILWFPHAECRWCERAAPGVCEYACHEGLECAELTPPVVVAMAEELLPDPSDVVADLVDRWRVALTGADRRHVVLRQDWPELAKLLDSLVDTYDAKQNWLDDPQWGAD